MLGAMGISKRTYTTGTVRWVVRVQHRGERVFRGPFRQEWQAAKVNAEMQEAIAKGTFDRLFGDRAVPSFCELAEIYLGDSRDRNTTRTVESKESHIEKLKEMLGEDTMSDRITPFDIDRIRLELRRDRAGPTVNRYLATLSGMFKVAVSRGYIDSNPVREIRRYAEHSGCWKILSVEQFDQLHELAAEDHRPHFALVLLTLWDTGMRVSEIPKKWEDINFRWGPHGGIFLKTTKNHESRWVPLTKRLSTQLQAHQEEIGGELVFPHFRSYDNLHTAFERIRNKAGISVRMHDLRHSYATRLIEAGAHAKKVQRILGHKSGAMLDRYVHLTDTSAADVVDLLETDSGTSSGTSKGKPRFGKKIEFPQNRG